MFKIMSNQISPTTSSHSDAARTAALYIRVSTQEQAELSPESQKRLLLDYAAAHGLSVPEEYIFTESVSGRWADKRPKFQEMIALAKHHAFQVILVWKYSRFARNQEGKHCL
ncbi:MAG: recombinase family protein [Lachnospiraceae bacterium]